ncbi:MULTISPECIES: PBSX family phage terminase large subunit [unclassified Gemella]|uniref:PBSX family phage terminase large subunit n=1 Tax=unclassified Gemella TaxID=2624949 RepID=UPI0015CFA92F|nr:MULTISPECIES: PBSX family phage terminase large subunit [unclassified Gemella]MBF0709739.1 PBSX family phage terminase large subunit [Gemella sp. GL1.1]NYS27083.1 PBSX family phage terminase large subunit [Gemella sp. GL1]
MSKFNLAKLVNPTFDSVLFSEKSHLILKGGRGSTKSSVISIKLVNDFLNDKLSNVVVLRKVGKYLRTSVYEQIKWAIYEMKVANQFTFGSSPLKITHKKTGTAFYFYGVDDPMKLKSQKIAKGYVTHVWFEELTEFAGREDIDVVEDTFIRQELPGNKQVKVYFSYNPPRNPYEWINEWVEEKILDPAYFIHHSTYLDDKLGFLSKQMKAKIERYKENDIDYYNWMYLGEVVGLGTNVYNINTFKRLDGLPTDDKIYGISFALDTGHQQSATACGAYAITVKGKVILLDTFYYSPVGKSVKKAPSELTVMIHEFIEAVIDKYKVPVLRRTIDSAEGALRNQYYHDYSIRWNPVAKKKNQTMIDMVVSLLASGRFYYLDNENNKIFVHEHKIYRYDEDTLNTPEPKVIKEDDHCCDFMKYFCLDNSKILGLS